MSIEFAEKILDGMVDENGHCGERGMSHKQFDCIARYLEAENTEWVNAWYGDKYGGRVDFYSTNYTGTVGKYQVVLNEFWHFNRRCTVVEINRRPQAEIDAENALRELGRFEHSEWVGEPKQRKEFELTLVRVHEYERMAYGRWNAVETVYIYTLADADGNCFVWKSANSIKTEVWNEDGWLVEETYAEPGDKVTMKATVKEHGEWKGTKQTVITRPKVQAIEKLAA